MTNDKITFRPPPHCFNSNGVELKMFCDKRGTEKYQQNKHLINFVLVGNCHDQLGFHIGHN